MQLYETAIVDDCPYDLVLYNNNGYVGLANGNNTPWGGELAVPHHAYIYFAKDNTSPATTTQVLYEYDSYKGEWYEGAGANMPVSGIQYTNSWTCVGVAVYDSQGNTIMTYGVEDSTTGNILSIGVSSSVEAGLIGPPYCDEINWENRWLRYLEWGECVDTLDDEVVE